MGSFIQHEFPSLRNQGSYSFLCNTSIPRVGFGLGQGSQGLLAHLKIKSFTAGSRNGNKGRSYEPTASREIEWEAAKTLSPSLEIS